VSVPAVSARNLDRRFERVVFYGYLLLLFWAPLPFGSNRIWGGALLFLLVAFLSVVLFVGVLCRKVHLAHIRLQAISVPVVLLLIVQLWLWFQTLPLPIEWLRVLSPMAAQWYGDVARAPLSLDAEATRFHALLSCTYLCGFLLTTLLVSSPRRLHRFLAVITASGVFQAMYGSLMTVSGLEWGFFVEKYSGVGVATGTFVNRNHLAGYLVMTLAAGIGLLLSRLEVGSLGSGRALLRSALKFVLGGKFLLRLSLAMMVIGLVLTRSRMGNLAFFVALISAGAVYVFSSRKLAPYKAVLLLVSVALIDLLIVGRWFGIEEVAQRLVATSVATESRDEVATLSMGIIQDYFWTGSGAGTFYTSFPYYSDARLLGDFYSHAHNDLVELAGDLGVPAFMALAAFLLLTLREGVHLQGQLRSTWEKGVGFSAVMVVGWGIGHSLADFNLYIPANAFTFVALLALPWSVKAFEKPRKSLESN
jgi:O-antigen ligase